MLREDPAGFWLGRVAPNSRKTYRHGLEIFVRWLNQRPGWSGVDARGLLERQSEAKNQYELLDLLQEFVSGLDRRVQGKLSVYTAVRSFFMHNRCALPLDPAFRVYSPKSPIVSQLTVDHIRDMVKAANLRDRSIVLMKWQSVQDLERTVYVCNCLSDQLVAKIKRWREIGSMEERNKQGIHPIRLDFPNRKNNPNPYYSFIYRDSIEALIAYFEQERGWPKKGEPIWLQKARTDKFSKTALSCVWMALVRRVGLVPKREGPAGSRYGFNSHDTRHVARSLLHTHALRDGFDLTCAEFWMGHQNPLDRQGYDKFFNDFEYVRKQALIAEPYLNILSQPQPSSEQDQEEIKTLKEDMAIMKDMLNGVAGALEKLGIKWIESKDARIFDLGKGKFIVQDKEESIR